MRSPPPRRRRARRPRAPPRRRANRVRTRAGEGGHRRHPPERWGLLRAGGRSERILLPTRVFRRGKRAMRLRVRHWRVVLDARENRTALPSSAAETYMPMPRNRSKCGWRRRIGRDDARERAVRAGGGRSAHLRRGFALGVRHRATRRSRTAGRRRVRDAQCRVNSCVNSGVNGFARRGTVAQQKSWDSTLKRGAFPLRGARGHNPRHRLEMTREERGGFP